MCILTETDTKHNSEKQNPCKECDAILAAEGNALLPPGADSLEQQPSYLPPLPRPVLEATDRKALARTFCLCFRTVTEPGEQRHTELSVLI